MPIYISMVRGINVGGNKRVSMSTLREVLEELGFEQVKTYVQSGNVVFRTARAAPQALSRKIEKAILDNFGFSVSVITKAENELGSVIQNNPFVRQKGIDPTKLHVTFLAQTPAKNLLNKLDALAVPPDQFRVGGTEIYIYCPNGYGISKLSNNAIERALAVVASTRNWKTVNALYKMASGG